MLDNVVAAPLALAQLFLDAIRGCVGWPTRSSERTQLLLDENRNSGIEGAAGRWSVIPGFGIDDDSEEDNGVASTPTRSSTSQQLRHWLHPPKYGAAARRGN
ncbi:hypothetical protein BKA62DRAFT_696952 [Auriculariales sp. MPI-PUGE-AT-0066]|nr:hypothetical protein BKA62DRAFT_696952 [Auriculariales sp. MPI-PUGE-AT-0066]